MRTRVISPIGLTAGVCGVVAALVGCARLSETTPVATTSASGSPAGTFAASVVSNITTVYTAHTVSFALDRIDQRTPPLDRTYRHTGSGKGVTVYVFDGGVSQDHPELAGR